MAMGSASNGSVSEKERVMGTDKKGSKMHENGVTASPAKTNKPPEIRVMRGRIYDAINGKSCHQCRQKTRDFVAVCTNLKNNNKQCPLMCCYKCLLNRYGEKAEEVSATKEWTCPRCRGICNCSICMKRKGYQPTGILINTAKATGFSSVSEMLLMGAGHLNNAACSPKKEIVSSLGKRGKENSFGGKVYMNLPNHIDKKSKKIKELQKGNMADNATMNVSSQTPEKIEVHDFTKEPRNEEFGGTEKVTKKNKRNGSKEMIIEENKEETEISVHDGDEKPKRSRKDKLENHESKKNDSTLARKTSPRKLKACNNLQSQVLEPQNAVDLGKNAMDNNIVTEKDCVEMNVQLPVGVELKSVGGIDLRGEDVGNALQFLEFCTVFGKILELKKGQPEHVLQDLLHGRAGRRGKFSLTVQFHINLLSIVLSEREAKRVTLKPSYGKNSWFDALKKCLSESKSVLKVLGLDSFDKATDYETLEASEKLKLLNILCDEVLETEKLKDWMEDQMKRHAEKVREAKQKVTAARDKEKNLKQKMKDDVADAIIAKNGVPLSISEHEAIVSDTKQKTAEANAKMLETKDMLLKSSKSDVLRIEPTFVGVGGHAYWKFNCMGKSSLVHQDVGPGEVDALTLDDKWFVVDGEGEETIEQYKSLS